VTPAPFLKESENLFAVELPLQKPVNEREGEHLVLLYTNLLHGQTFGSLYTCQVPRESTYASLRLAMLASMCSVLKSTEVVSNGHEVVRLKVMEPVNYLPSDVDHPLYMPSIDQALSQCQPDLGPVHVRLGLEWEEETRDRIFVVTSPVVEEEDSVEELRNQESQPTKASLEQCFQLYTEEEKLGPENPWLCPSCKRHQEGVKKLALWSVPDILIIHLKRFRQTSTQRTKLTNLVEFPVNGLDMTAHIVHRTNQVPPTNPLPHWSPWRRKPRTANQAEDSVYDLYAVCNHHGNMHGGHYTAYCKNPTDGLWYLFDDIKVTPVDESEIVTESAYILFYQKKALLSGSSSSASSSTSGSQDHWVYRMPSFNYNLTTSSKSQDNLLDAPEVPRPGFHRGARMYSSMVPLTSQEKRTSSEAELDRHSDEDSPTTDPSSCLITESEV